MPKHRWLNLSTKPLLVAIICAMIIGAGVAPGMAQDNSEDNTSHTVTISSSGEPVSYFFRATGGLLGGDSIETEGDDDVGNHRGRGVATSDNADTYRYNGQLSLMLTNNTDALTVKVDGDEVSIGDIGSPDASWIDTGDSAYQPPHLIAITTSGDLIDYEFSSTGPLELTDDVDTDDRDNLNGKDASGTVGLNGFDTYRFRGEIATFETENFEDLTVYIDGDKIDPGNLESSGDSSQTDQSSGDSGDSNNSADQDTETDSDNSSDSDSDSDSGSDQSSGDSGEEPSVNPGDYKIRDLNIGPQPVRVGEDLRVNVTIANTASERIRTEIGLATEGEVVDTQTVGLFPPGQREVAFEYSYDSPGTYSIRVGAVNEDGSMVSVSRRDPSVRVVPESATIETPTPTTAPNATANNTTTTSANASNESGLNGSLEVTRLSPAQQTIGANETAMWDLVIANTGTENETSDVVIRMNSSSSVIRQDTLSLAPGDSRGVTFSHRFTNPGEHSITVGAKSANVTVFSSSNDNVSVFQTTQATTTPFPTETPTTTAPQPANNTANQGISVANNSSGNNTSATTSSSSGPGFGVLLTIIAVIASSMSILYRYRKTD